MKTPRGKSSSSPQSRPSKRSQPSDTKTEGQKLWGGRFQGHTHKLVETFTASVSFDRRLYEYDIEGSIAHCKTLQRAKVLSAKECQTIIRGLQRIREDIRGNRHPWKVEDEDVHMSIERKLIQLIGPIGGKLHTGRSRNDQICVPSPTGCHRHGESPTL